jgi:hypothetical protein
LGRSVRENIIEGLMIAGQKYGDQGVISYVAAAAAEDFKNGLALLALVCPKAVEARINSQVEMIQKYESAADVARDLQRLGVQMPDLLPDFVGDPIVDEAELVEGEIGPPK